MYSSRNFIIPLQSTDQTLKIRNIEGITTSIIKEADCTIKVELSIITIKQSSESVLIRLQFSSPSDAQSAHVLLRQALTSLKSQQIGSLPPGPVQQPVRPSLHSLYQPTITTFQDGQWPGTPGLVDPVIGRQPFVVFINGLKALIGNGCSSSQFLIPDFDLVFAKIYITFNRLSATTIQIANNDIVVGDSIIITDNGIIKCFDVVVVNGNTITLSGSSIGPITTLHRPKRWGTIDQGDQILWFGSNAGYELDSNDIIQINYLTQP